MLIPIDVTMFSTTLCNNRLLRCAAKATASAMPLQRLAFAGAFASTRLHSTGRGLIRDSSYPFPLYYHFLPPSDTQTSTTSAKAHSTYALSFLPAFPKHNRQVIGTLTHNSSSDTELRIHPSKFTENEPFNNILHATIQEHLSKDPMVESVLQQQLEGWTHIADYRNPAPYGRIPLPEDIFGSVQIVDGVIQPSTYQRMPSHRIVSINGLFQLSDYLHEKLVHRLQNL